MDYTILAQVKTFVAKQAVVSEEKLDANTELADDLGIDGDDALEFIEEFCETFHLQNLSDFHFEDYFAPEGFDLLGFLYCLLFDRQQLRGASTPITLQNLATSVEAKRWIPPQVKQESITPFR